MLIGNIRSIQDLKSKKELQKQLLDLEVANESVNQKRQQEAGVKETEVKRIPEQYRTAAEIQKDRVSLEKKVLDNLAELGFTYAESGQLTSWLSVSNRLADFNSIFKGLKKDLLDNYDKSVITPGFLKDYLDNTFDDLDTNLGKKFSKDIANVPVGGITSLDALVAAVPNEVEINGLVAVLDTQRSRFARNVNVMGAIDAAISLLKLYQTLLPSDDIFSNLQIAVTQNDRMKVIKRIMTLLTKAQFIDRNEISSLTEYLSDEALDNITLMQIVNRLVKQLYYFTDLGKINDFVKIYRDLIKLSENNPNIDNNKVSEEINAKIRIIEEGKKAARAETDLAFEQARQTLNGEEIVAYYNEIADRFENDALGIGAFAANIFDALNEYATESELNTLNNAIENKGVRPSYGELRGLLIKLFLRKKRQFPDYDPRPQANDPRQRGKLSYVGKKGKDKGKNKSIRNREGLIAGLGADPSLLSRLKKHFKGDEKLLKKVVKVMHNESSSSDSDSEAEEKELNRHIKATDGLDRKLEGLTSAKGLGFKATRISAKKVGKGVKLEKEDNPTYRQFGKYVIHIPYLLNNSVANFKYPSLGSIPSIKPTTVSEDYKDLLLDVLQTGKLNKKELDRLSQSEIKHFEKVAVGAGLVEQLGLKVGSTDEDKSDTKRFELLRGEYLAGNNNDKLIKELRQLITKFINNGRMHKTEGLNLLLELSTL